MTHARLLRNLAPAAAALALAACQTGPSPQRIAFLNTLIGRSETDLVRTLGVPNRSVETGGHKFLAYRQQDVTVLPGWNAYPYPWWGWGGFGAVSGEVVVNTCETTFELADSRVLRWSLRGNSC